MAEGALFDLAGKVIDVLGSFIAEEVELAFGVKTEIENLKSTVSTIQAVLLDAEKRSSHSHQIKDWLSKLKDVLHDADDLLDDFSTQILRQKVKKEVRLFFSSSNQLYFSVKMGHELKAIRKRLNAIAKDKEDFQFCQSLVEPLVMNRGDRETYSFVLKDEVIGREDDKKEIMKRLFDDNVVENISIIPIVGIGGLGKTTLAQLVYNDEYVQTKFDKKLWVCVSDIFEAKRIVKEIVEQLTKSNHEGSIEMLQTQLQEELNGKRYLLVLDDLWNENSNKWLLLRNLLMGGKRGSRIIVTARSISVARIIGATSWHALRGLPEEKAWSLFVKVAFKQGKLPENKVFISLGKEIMRKCAGVPLAIRTIASLLHTKDSENDWRYFGRCVSLEITQEEEKENDILSTLKLSYDHLPSYLKQCFAYCSLFPKDYKICVTALINLWAAQGFIKLSNSKQRIEDIGRKYFMVLLWRCFFQDVQKDEYGNISYCKMHDLMHDLAALVAGMESIMLNSSEEYNGEKVRHVSFNLEGSSMQFSIPMPNGRKIHTVLASSIRGNLGNLTCDAFISNFKYLRTLGLRNLGLFVVPHSIGKLMHLRYLELSGNRIEILPNSITKMLNLQTLILRNCGSLRELPRGIKKLVNLRFLDITGCRYQMTNMPLEIGHLTYLETILPSVVVRMEGSRGQAKKGHCGLYKKTKAKSNGGPSQLKLLHNLGGQLRIENLGHGKDEVRECKDANLKDKQHLQHLVLKWDDSEWYAESECYDEMLLEGLQPHPYLKVLELQFYMGVRIPSWVSSLTNLVCFKLHYNKRLQHLPPLNQLPFLKSVDLMYMEALEYISGEDSVSNVLGASTSSSSSSKTPFFPSLSSLRIEECPKLKGWWRNSDDDDDDNEPHHLLLPSFPPSLSNLQIFGCPNLTSMPLIPNLTFLNGPKIDGYPLLRLQGRLSQIIQQEKTIYSESDLESELVYSLPEEEFVCFAGEWIWR